MKNAQQPVFQLNFVDAAEEEKVLTTFNATERTLPPPYDHVTIHGLFEYWAEKTPDARAISFEVSTSYGVMVYNLIKRFLIWTVSCKVGSRKY